MKCNNKLKRNDFWKIECLDCGVNADLLTDSWKRIICRECLNKNEFSEVENEIYADSDIKKESIGNRYVLCGSNIANPNHRDSINEKTNEIPGVE